MPFNSVARAVFQFFFAKPGPKAKTADARCDCWRDGHCDRCCCKGQDCANCCCSADK